MKRLRIIITILLMLNLLSTITFAEENISEETVVDKFMALNQTVTAEEAEEDYVEQKVHCTATADDEFREDEVLIVLSKEQSRRQQEYIADDFPGLGVKNVIALYDYYPEDRNNIILMLTLDKSDKQNVIDTISVLEQDERIISAEPNYTFAVEMAIDSSMELISSYASNDSLNNEYSSDLHTYACCARKYIDPNKNNAVKVGVVDVGIYSNIPGVSDKVVKYVDCRYENENTW